MRFLSRFFDTNDREVSRLQPIVDEINALEDEYAALSDEEIRERIDVIKADIREVAEGEEPSEDELHHPDSERRSDLRKARRKRENERITAALDDVIPEVFAAAREASKRTLEMRHFDVQLIGGIVLHQGKIAEMKTGEGKTLVPTLALTLNGLTGRGAHLVTVNDYLARRDAQWMGPVYHFLGLSVGVITHDTSYLYEPGFPTTDERLINLRPVTRREAYAADITYGTNNEFGFDYLRDNMVDQLESRVQRERSYAIVDEVDNILIDEARTPLIISGQAEESADLYFTFARLVPKLEERPEGAEEGGDYFLDLKDKAVSPTEEGVDKIEKLLGIPNLYDADPRLARHFDSALKAHALYKRDRDYIVEGGEIVIVDEFTGRKMPGRRWSEGLHQAIEAKEGLRVQRESRTLATITFQNYFRLYDKLAGMTGTAMTEAEEFHKIYALEVVAIPTHRPMIREDLPDLVYKNEASKFNALIDEIEEMTAAGRPVLVGTVSVEKSEVLATLMKRRGIRHEVLNAKQHERESGVVAQAGRSGTVTIATNMAGRGTDIKLGGDPAGLASEILHKRGLNPAEVDKATYEAALAEARTVTEVDHAKVVDAGGLHIIGTERHDSRRIDNQLRGRAGRQGDPGSSRFYLSLEDDLMKRFASERVAGLMERLGLDDETAIESGLVSKTIASAQNRVEGFNFDIRKRVVEFDDVINKQRETIYAERDKVLRNEDLTETVRDFLEAEVDAMAEQFLGGSSPAEWNLEALSVALKTMGLAAEDVSEEVLDGFRTREELVAHVHELVDGELEQRQSEHGDEVWGQVERFVLLRTIDSLWVEHLTEIDDMRRGIGLRGYAQQDPLNEFRKEAYRLYEELSDLIRRQVATTIFRVTVKREPTTMPLPGPGQPARGGEQHTHADGSVHAGPPHDEAPAGGGAAAAAAAVTATGSAGGSIRFGPTGSTSSAGTATAAPISGLPADPMKTAREVPGDAAATGLVRQGFTPSGARIGRNDPCWCGSGQKYKKCHGA
ncbi:MAG TPA: preprotein translocase subunit SecA [Candidatus Limnocylindrales bacterium]|nr:preprotein translocase subunit SecA [Candidatus Limnocylindrales bacterium]